MSVVESIEEKVKRIIIEVLELSVEPAEISDTDLLFGGALGFDSIATLNIIAALEEGFEIEIGEDYIGTELFRDVGTLAACVREHITPASY